jgi:O-antigen ligase
VKRIEAALDWLVAAMLAVTVFAFASGSSIEYQVLDYGRTARWVCLFVLLGLSLVYAGVARPRARAWRLPRSFFALASSLVVLALVSSAWSVDAWLTLRRAGSFAVLLAIAACLLAATRGRQAAVRRLLAGLLAGAVAVGVAGLVLLAADYDAAVQPASTQYPARFQGFEQNPNTAALLFALAIPIAAYLLLASRSWLVRGPTAATLLLFVGSLAASGSRGPMVGALAGTLVVFLTAPRGRRARLVLAAATVAIFAACVGISRIPDAKPAPASTSGATVIRRTLFTSSGRRAAWTGAIHEAERRPVAGYGFGTEALVFVDRYANFDSDLVENSYIGAALQLGIVGLAILLAVAAAAFVFFAKRVSRPPPVGIEAACAGAAAAALVAAVTQSYLFSVGNIGTVTAWVCLFLLAGLAGAAPAGAQPAAETSSERIPSRETAGSQSG